MAILNARSRWSLATALAAVLTISVAAQQMQPTPNRRQGEGDGPFDRLVIRGVTVIDGTGAPPRGPMDIVVVQDRITEIASVGYPKVPIGDRGRPATSGIER